jgi:uncharacterized protein (TIRG00374 family)
MRTAKISIPFRKIILWTVVILSAVYIALNLTELESIAEALSQGHWLFLLLALGLALLVLVNNAFTYWALYRLVGIRERRRQFFLLSTASTFVGIIAPSGGMSSLTLFIDSARRRKQSTARVVVVGLLYIIYEYASLLLMVLLGMIVLFRRGNLHAGEVAAALVMLAFALGISGVLYFGYKSPERLGRILTRLGNFLNKLLRPILHRQLVSSEAAVAYAGDIGKGLSALQHSRTNLIRPFLFAMLNKALLCGVLMSIFLAFAIPFSAGTVIGGFSIGQLFYYISPTPGGVGVVEGLFPVILRILNVPYTKATLVTLVYRLLTLWLTFGIGFFCFRAVEQQSQNALDAPVEELPVQNN